MVLASSEFEVSGCSDLRVKDYPSTVATSGYPQVLSSELFVTDDGRTVRGKSAHYNTPYFGLTISRRGSVQPSVRVQFSASKVHGREFNFDPIGCSQFSEGLARLENDLHQIGVRVSLTSAHLRRIDIFKNIFIDRAYEDYTQVLASLTSKRMTTSEWGGETYRWGNRQHQVVSYSKNLEMIARAKKQPDLQKRHSQLKAIQDKQRFPETLRIEYRLLRTPKVRSVVGVQTAEDLIHRWHKLEEAYRSFMKDNLFKPEPPASLLEAIPFGPETRSGRRRAIPGPRSGRVQAIPMEQGLHLFRERGGRYWLQNWLHAYLLTRISSHAESLTQLLSHREIEQIRACCRRVTADRSLATRAVNQLRQLALDAEAISAASSGRPSHADLYRELRQKVLGEAP